MTTPLRERLSDQIAYLTDNPPEQVKTDSVVWRDTVTLLREALAALSSGAVAPREEWQPIATAPKNGTVVLGWFPYHSTTDEGGGAYVMRWGDCNASMSRPFWEASGWVWGVRDNRQKQPTHWMSLPASPGASRAAETPEAQEPPEHVHSRACDCVGTIRYRKDGEERTWGVGSACTSTVQGLEAHLRRWIPDAKFVDATIEPARAAGEAQPSCSNCGCEVRGQGGYLQCECPYCGKPLVEQRTSEQPRDDEALDAAVDARTDAPANQNLTGEARPAQPPQGEK